MKTDLRLVVVALLVIAGLRADAVAQTVDLSSPIRAGARTTYLDLLQKLMPDARADATAQNTIPLRSIVEPKQKSALSGQMKFEFEPHWFNSDGKRLLMLKVDLTAPELNDGTPYAGEAVAHFLNNFANAWRASVGAPDVVWRSTTVRGVNSSHVLRAFLFTIFSGIGF
ncbi:MAG TPA: hypothetical protein VFR12_01610 [Pyrinomonadaceae bacterium]|nr:hypothetical protein [Pyrinomonadaceae bacterium]